MGTTTDIELVTSVAVPTELNSQIQSQEVMNAVTKATRQRAMANAKAAWAVAFEKNTFYLEDAIKNAEERNRVLTGYYKDPANMKAAYDGTVNHAIDIQEYLDNIPDHSVVRTRPNSVFVLDKNVGYKPEIFGADNRSITRGGSRYAGVAAGTQIVDGLQPCLAILDKHNLYIDFAGTLFLTKKLGQSTIYLGSPTGNSGGHFIKSWGTHRTIPYMMVGYKGGRQGLFPPMDGWTEEKPWLATGYGAKGYYKGGFNTANFIHDFSNYDNNCCRTENVTSKPKELDLNTEKGQIVIAGGYISADGTKHEFPQEDGTVAETWGTWRGLKYGSVGNAIVITGDVGSTTMHFDVAGFFGDAIMFGKLGTWDGLDVARGDVSGARAHGCVADSQTVLGGTATHNYIGYIGVSRGNNIRVSGVDCKNSHCGHPDFSVAHSRDKSDVTIDPGYGFHTGRALPCSYLYIFNNHWGTCARKCMDAHCGNYIYFEWNTGRAGRHGVSVVIQEDLAVDASGNKVEKETHEDQTYVLHIKNNTFHCGWCAVHCNNGSFGPADRLGKVAGKEKWFFRVDVQIVGNYLTGPRPIFYNYGHSGFVIKDNTMVFALPFGDYYGMRRITAGNIVKAGTGYKVGDKIYPVTTARKARDCEFEVSSVDGNGGITGIRLLYSGSDYFGAKVASRIVSEAGTGAEITLIPRADSVALVIGAINNRGPAFGDIICDNKILNGPDGNYGYAFYLGALVGATISGNRVDVTPYYTMKDGQATDSPYASERPCRSGLPTNPHSGGESVEFSHIENNKAFNRATGQVDEMFKNLPKNTAIEGRTNTITRTLTIPRGEDEPEPRSITPPTTDTSPQEVVFDFTGDFKDDRYWDKAFKYRLTHNAIERIIPQGYSMVKDSTEEGKPSLLVQDVINGNTAGVAPYIPMNLMASAGNSAIAVRFKIKRNARANFAYVLALNTVTDGNVAAVAYVLARPVAGDATKFTLDWRSPIRNVYVDGQPCESNKTQYAIADVHTIALDGAFTSKNVVFGPFSYNQVANIEYADLRIFRHTAKDDQALATLSTNNVTW